MGFSIADIYCYISNFLFCITQYRRPRRILPLKTRADLQGLRNFNKRFSVGAIFVNQRHKIRLVVWIPYFAYPLFRIKFRNGNQNSGNFFSRDIPCAFMVRV